jgi:hypothetical protein
MDLLGSPLDRRIGKAADMRFNSLIDRAGKLSDPESDQEP